MINVRLVLTLLTLGQYNVDIFQKIAFVMLLIGGASLIAYLGYLAFLRFTRKDLPRSQLQKCMRKTRYIAETGSIDYSWRAEAKRLLDGVKEERDGKPILYKDVELLTLCKNFVQQYEDKFGEIDLD